MDSVSHAQKLTNQLSRPTMTLRKRLAQTHSMPLSKNSLSNNLTSKPTVKQRTKTKKLVCQCLNCNADDNNKIRDLKGKPLHLCHYPGCERDFSRAGNLLRHLDWHKGNINFVCKYCDKKFTRKRNLNAHVKTHANVVPNKPNDNVANDQLLLTNHLAKLILENNNGTQSHRVEYEPTESDALLSSSLTKTSTCANFGVDDLDVDLTITENLLLTVKNDYFVQESIPSSLSGQISECYSKVEKSLEMETENFVDSNDCTKNKSSVKPNQITKQFLLTPPTCKEEIRFSCSDKPNSNSHVSSAYQTQFESEILLPLIEKLLKEKLKVSDLTMKNANSNNQDPQTFSPSATPVINIQNVYVTLPDTMMMLPVWDTVSNSKRLIPVALSESNMSFTVPEDAKKYFDNPDFAAEAPLNTHENQPDIEVSLPFMSKLNDSLSLDDMPELEFQAPQNDEPTESQCTNFNDDDGNATILSEIKLRHVSPIPDCERAYSEEQQTYHFQAHLEEQYRNVEGYNDTKSLNDKNSYIESSNFEKQYCKIKGHNDIKSSVDEKSYVCHIPDCGKAFGYLHTLQRHIEWHSGKKNFFCKHCDKGFMRKDHLVSHVTRIHNNPKQEKLNNIRDDIDGKSASTSDDQSYVCQVPNCGKVFSRVDFLERHLKEHSDEQNLICVHCEEEFTCEDHLVNHVERIHINPKQKESNSIKIDADGKFTGINGESQYICHIPNCNKVFGYRHTLRRHLEWHSGKKNFFCPYCNKGFARKDHLVSHVRVHTNTKLQKLDDSKADVKKHTEFNKNMLKKEIIDRQVSQNLSMAKSEIA